MVIGIFKSGAWVRCRRRQIPNTSIVSRREEFVDKAALWTFKTVFERFE